MKTAFTLRDFDFALPDDLIAQYPLAERRSSRLLRLDRQSGAVQHAQFCDLMEQLKPDDMLIFNDTKVIPARLYGHKSTGGKVELLIERIISEYCAVAHVKASKAPLSGTMLHFEEAITAEVTGREGDLFSLEFQENQAVSDVLDRIGHIPLPPYIKRHVNEADLDRYQTVYAAQAGAVAAPTAGLHFDDAFFQALATRGIAHDFITLHVGAGTFQPVRVDDVTQHQMHAEYLTVSQAVCERIRQHKARGGRIIAIGTTVVRALETAAQQGDLHAYQGPTDIFIYPGYTFHVIDALLTNFHLPQSTLLMLVSAFAGYDATMAAYQAAVTERYRFFSYGDAMFIGDHVHAV